MSKYAVTARGIGVSIPPSVVSNDDLTSLVDTSDEWIHSRTGFKARHVVSGNESVTDLAIESARNALAFAGMNGEDIDLIILASSTPDNIYPAACGIVQQAIGATKAFGFDMMMGCSGFVYAMGAALQFLENGTAKNALIIGADIHSRFTDWYDRNTCVLFGDGAGSIILSRKEAPSEETDFLAVDFMLDGSRGEEIKLPINRDNCPLVEPRSFTEKSAIYMNGREVFKFAVGDVPKLMEATLARINLTPRDVDYFIMHQANARIMSAMSERMDIRPEQMIVSVENYGNTSAASIPLALYDSVMNGTIRPGQKLVLCGYGAGLAVATAVLNWTCVDQRPDSDAAASASQQNQNVSSR